MNRPSLHSSSKAYVGAQYIKTRLPDAVLHLFDFLQLLLLRRELLLLPHARLRRVAKQHSSTNSWFEENATKTKYWFKGRFPSAKCEARVARVM